MSSTVKNMINTLLKDLILKPKINTNRKGLDNSYIDHSLYFFNCVNYW